MTCLGASQLSHFTFPATSININNGSFGSCPTFVRDAQKAYQRQLNAEPDVFMRYKLPSLIDRSRAAVASLINAHSVDDVVLVQNATTGVNTVLWNLRFSPGRNKIVYLGTTYPACEKIIDFIGELSPDVEAVRVEIQYPMSKSAILRDFEHAISQPGVHVALFDTISSLPAMRLPFEDMVRLCKQYNVLSLIDGAHSIGCLPLDMQRLDADFFVSNLHKWLFTPHSCAALHIPARNHHLIRSSLPTSHGYTPVDKPGKPQINNPLPTDKNKPALARLFEFVGTLDYTPFLCVPEALEFRQRFCGGEEAVMQYCIDLARNGCDLVAQILQTEVLGELWQRECPMGMVRLPLDARIAGLSNAQIKLIGPWVQRECVDNHGFFVPVVLHNGSLWVRLSGQVYLTLQDFEKVGNVLQKVCNLVKVNDVWTQ